MSRRHKHINYGLFFCLMLFYFAGCKSDIVLDVNVAAPDNNWLYSNTVKETFEIKDTTAAYRILFKLRNTSGYSYSNLYVLSKLRGPGGMSKQLRHQFQLAAADGRWLGKGSGDLFTSELPLYTSFRFPAAGTYTIEVEQNMRDNPLTGISDIGVKIEAIR